MKHGARATDAVTDVTGRDSGRHHRQLSALDTAGGTGGFTGEASIPSAGVRQARHVIVAGNMLTSEEVLDAALRGFLEASGDLDERLLQALAAAAAAGGDSRGFMSAALLVVSRDKAPLTLRIDHADDPLADLRSLHRRATTGAYARWAALVPTPDNPERSEPSWDRVE
jgi:uncharacterized Ntn-hydrolase superfamily protein